jgi:hypothetical protein
MKKVTISKATTTQNKTTTVKATLPPAAVGALVNFGGLPAGSVTTLETVFDLAIIYGHRAGVSMFKAGQPVDNYGDWTADDRRAVLALRSFFVLACKSAKDVYKISRKGMSADLTELCGQYSDVISEIDAPGSLLKDIFHVSMFYKYAVAGSHCPVSELVELAQLLEASAHLLGGFNEPVM